MFLSPANPFHDHHNLGFDVVGHDGRSASTRKGGQGRFLSNSEDDDDQHGTAMAGIISARRGETGVIGVNPTAHIFSVDWDYYRFDMQKRLALVNILGPHIKPQHLPIFVFATDWESSGSPLSPCNQRQNSEILGNFMVNTTTPLIIAAAGDAPKGTVTGLDVGGTDGHRRTSGIAKMSLSLRPVSLAHQTRRRSHGRQTTPVLGSFISRRMGGPSLAPVLMIT